jgi:YYY domain-containing protein
MQILRESWRALTEATGGRLAFVIYAVSLGGLSFLNTWDFPIYLSVIGLTLIVWLWYRTGNGTSAMQQGIIGTVYLGLAGVILYLPFYATFQSQARGILPNLWNPTRLPQFFVFFGPFLVATLGLLIILSGQSRGWKKQLSWTLPLTILGPVLAMLVALTGVLISPAGREYVQGILNNSEVQQLLGNNTIGALVQESLWRRVLNPWTFLLLGGLLGWVLALLIGESPNQQTDHPPNRPTIKFVLILLLVGLGLPLAVEFVYLRDNFGIRMNTIFKFYFQAWVLLALVSAFAVYYVSKSLRGAPALVWQVSMAVLVAASMIYPILAVADKANYFKNEPTLNGTQWIANYQPGDYAAIEWLRANAPDDAVVLEAPGARYAAYQYTGRVSALTGLPTLLGWGGHQSQWRGNYDEPARREPEIEVLFNSSDLGQTQELLDKYNITYVYVGPLERERYSPQGLNKFDRLMDIVFQQDDVIIYQRR